MTGRRVPIGAAAAVAAACLVAACGGDDGQAAGGGSDGDGPGGTIRVLAAASLSDVFDEVAAAFEEANSGVSVELDYGASSGLRDQILAGAPADVFAAANTDTMDAVDEGGGLAGARETFATNRLEIAVPAGNEAGVDGLDDFGDESLLVGLCDEQVPCGDFARQALDAAGVTPEPDTNEPDVRALLDKVAAGELDAGIVYVTDVLAAGEDVEGIEIPGDQNRVADYPIATLSASGNRGTADAFVAFVLSPAGQAILARYGFGPPDAS